MNRSFIAGLAFVFASTLTLAEGTSTTDVNRRALERRAAEALIWGMPAVNFELMYDAFVKTGGSWNQVVYWSHLGSKDQTLTPNPDVIYVNPFYDTRKGPVVLEIPAASGENSITGSIDEGWQNALEDVGPAGVDKGKGGKYLILPPGYKGKAPAGYIALQASVYTGFAILRSNIGTGTDAERAKAAEYGKRVKIYPLADAANPPATKFIDAADLDFDATIPYDARFYERLNSFVQREPWIERDRAMIEILRSIGIEKGKPFSPDAKTQESLKNAATEAHAWLDSLYEANFTPPFFAGSHWAVPVPQEVIKGLQSNFADGTTYPYTGRAVMYMIAYFSAKHLGTGQFYTLAFQDKAGKPLDGAKSYRLTVPPKVPVKLYWSVTAYDRATHALIKDQKWNSRASTSQGIQKNADGSTDVYFGPNAPAGKESNWVPTRAGAQFELLFRFYGPDKALFDKSWLLTDLEEMK